MYALVEIKGKQYKAEKGKRIKVDKLDGKIGDKIEFDKVIMIGGTEEVKIGTPYLQGVKIAGTLENHLKDRKIIVYKYKRRKGYRRKRGHRQQYSYIKVDDIVGL
ncbi:MAG: 50S ribosomal protein L21 [Spirochaetes bacterium]|nr:MAG: 50S ribosomal protein L21 [Spirochaetota bacterium]